MQSAHVFASSEVKGVAQIRHEGPVYFFIPDQHDEQNGAVVKLSVSFPQLGHSEGKRTLMTFEIRPGP